MNTTPNILLPDAGGQPLVLAGTRLFTDATDEVKVEIQRQLPFWTGDGHSMHTNPLGILDASGYMACFVDAGVWALSRPNYRELWSLAFVKQCHFFTTVQPEKCPGFLDWLHSGHFIFSNPWGVECELGTPLDYISACSYVEDMARIASAMEDSWPPDECDSVSREAEIPSL